MATNPDNPNLAHRGAGYRLQVNSFDRASSMLVSLLVIVASAVIPIVIILFFRQFTVRSVAIPVESFIPGDPGEAAKGYERDIEPPGLEDAPELTEPALQDTLQALSTALSDTTALLSDEAFDAAAEAGRGSGKGDSRQTGTGGTGGRDCEKQLRFEPKSIADYAKMLDFFGCELAVIDTTNNKILYAKGLSKPTKAIRSGTPAEEKRFKFWSTGPPLASMEARLAREAGIMRDGAIVMVFYPEEVAGQIYGLERQAMEANGIKSREQVLRTVFRVEPQGGGYQFRVESQLYR